MSAILIAKKCWAWLKEYWQVPVVIVYTILMAVVFRRNTKALEDTLTAKKQSYEAQVRALKVLHEEEILRRDGLIEEYQELIQKLEQEYAKKEEVLSEQHKDKVRKMVIDSKGAPEEVKKKVQSMFGFEYVD